MCPLGVNMNVSVYGVWPCNGPTKLPRVYLILPKQMFGDRLRQHSGPKWDSVGMDERITLLSNDCFE